MNGIGDRGPITFRARRGHPCEACGSESKGCSATADGLRLCRGEAGPEWQRTGGDDQFTYYRHRDDRRNLNNPTPPTPVFTTSGTKDWAAEARKYAANLTDGRRAELAGLLGLPAESLTHVEHLGYLTAGEGAWTFPERDGAGRIIGIVKRPREGNKLAMSGSARGLTIPAGWRDRPGPVVLVEGASDTIALTFCGLAAIGRPSNTGGVDHLAALLADLPADRTVVVLVENDQKPNGLWPGRDGAEKTAAGLAGRLPCPVFVACPPDDLKDARCWAQAVAAESGSWSGVGAKIVDHITGAAVGHVGLSDCRTGSGAVSSTEYVPFPVDVFPPPWDQFVRQGAASLGVDPGLVAIPLLSVLAGAVGNTRRVCLKPDWPEPAVIWSCIVAESGGMKSPALDLSVNLVRGRERKLAKEYQDALALHKRDRDRVKREGFSTDLSAPVMRRILVGDITVEKLAVLLDENPRGLLLHQDELAGWFTSFTKYKSGGGTDEPRWLEMHRAKALQVDRKTGDKTTLFIPQAAVSICGSIQPGKLRDLASRDLFDSGLVARFVFAMPPRARKRWTKARVPDATLAAARESLATLYELEGAAHEDDGRPDPATVFLDPTAEGRFARFVDEWGERTYLAEGDDAAALSKLEGLAGRWALIHHTTATAGSVGPIGLASVEAGIRLAEWCAAETGRVYSLFLESAGDRQSRRLLALVTRLSEKHGRPVTPRDVQNSNGKAYRTADDARSALNELARRGQVVRDGDGYRPSPTVRQSDTSDSGT